MAMVLVVFITASTMLFSAVRPPSRDPDHDIDTSKELMKAKEALIAYAINYAGFNSSDDGPGRLPCPDSSVPSPKALGLPDASCNSTDVHRLPEYVNLPTGGRFEINDRYAEVDRQFWYAITPDFRHNYSGGVVNSSTSTSLFLDGDPVVAVVIAPGAELSGQSRPSSDVTGADHLEGGNQNSTNFVSRNAADPDVFNDLAIGITKSELMTPITDIVVSHMKEAMDYWTTSVLGGNGYIYQFYIWTWSGLNLIDSYSGTPNWYFTDAWKADVETYTVNPAVPNIATIKFKGCASVFTLTSGGGITRNPAKC